ncbi:DUF1129 family protein [Planococcus versutus]|uniref:DUF1129 domain-containing protein n=1 Tax=Planococcus versutus TaxID=1302659 RepID=A0A1B1S418_9BACL|nr:DUF1129 family protein [Planococcus versutus]ANU27922.1 hypothetical protein I858_013090 [Planococcus versutus]
MRGTTKLIKENNDKRKLLTSENEKLYEDLLLYIRTDLRVDERAAEELLMDLLDHLIEAQRNGKDATDLFGDSPEAYADELIANMPKENKRNVILQATSFTLGLAGWFTLTYGVLNGIISVFTSIDNDFALGSISIIFLAIVLVGVIGLFIIFRLIRTSVFKPEIQEWKIYVVSGLYGMIAFAFILGVGYFFDGIGPIIQIQWWVLFLIGLALVGLTKGLSRLSLSQ